MLCSPPACLLFSVCRLLFTLCCSLVAGCLLLFTLCCSLFAVRFVKAFVKEGLLLLLFAATGFEYSGEFHQ